MGLGSTSINITRNTNCDVDGSNGPATLISEDPSLAMLNEE